MPPEAPAVLDRCTKVKGDIHPGDVCNLFAWSEEDDDDDEPRKGVPHNRAQWFRIWRRSAGIRRCQGSAPHRQRLSLVIGA